MIPHGLVEKVFSKRIPIDVQIELTWRCNQRCLHCYQYVPQGGELSTIELKDIISQLAQAGTLYLSFTGGEPLLREDFWEIADYAASKDFALFLQTNGSLIDERAARRLAASNFFVIHISLLGAAAETHDAITQTPGSFERVMEAVRQLLRYDIRVIFNVTLMKINFSEYDKIRALGKAFGEKVSLRVSPYVFYKNDGNSYPASLRLDDEQMRQVFTRINEEFPDSGITNAGLMCNFGWCGCTISAQGEVYPCAAVCAVAGRLRERSFREIWQESPVFSTIRCASLDDLQECRGCEYVRFCFRCSGFSYTENQRMFGCSPEIRRIARITKEVHYGA